MIAVNKRMTNTLTLAAALLIVLPGCASQRPSLYSNEHSMRVGSSQAERDIDQCVQQAEGATEGRESAGENAVVTTAGSAAIGAAAGGAGGAVVGQAGQGAVVGAASSAAAGLMYSLLRGLFGSNSPAPSYKAFVDRCLREKGYDPAWN
jgi:hypothetical protein